MLTNRQNQFPLNVSQLLIYYADGNDSCLQAKHSAYSWEGVKFYAIELVVECRVSPMHGCMLSSIGV